MLESLEQYLEDHGIQNYATKIAMAQELPIGDSALDAVFCFNAIHFFQHPEIPCGKCKGAKRGIVSFYLHKNQNPEHEKHMGKALSFV